MRSRGADCGLPYFAQRDPLALAIVDWDGRHWSRRELWEAVNQIAHALRQRGLNEHDVIAILAPNCFEFLATYLAAIDIGLYVVPINWHLSPVEIVYILESSGAVALFAHQRLAPLVRRLVGPGGSPTPRLRISFGTISGFIDLQAFSGAQCRDRVSHPSTGRVMMYTSATTGRPKAISVPDSNAAGALARTIEFHNSCGIRLEDSNVHLCASALYHGAPLEFSTIALHMGHTLVLLDRWDPEKILLFIQRYRVTTSFMVPAMFVRLVKLSPEIRARYDVSSLRLVAHSAAPCPQETKRKLIEWWGPVIWESYGAAEGGGTAVSSAEWLRHPGTVGRPIPGTILRILDDSGQELPPGQIGSIYLSRFTGERFEYRDDPEKTRAAYCGDLFTVGDLGYVDEGGRLFICGRKVDMVICSGMNIYCAEIEQVLLEHPTVLDCAVFGIPDDLTGEAICAVVQPSLGAVANANLTSDITSFLRQRLAAVKVPRRIDYLSELPRDPNGKLYKRALREKYWEGYALKL